MDKMYNVIPICIGAPAKTKPKTGNKIKKIQISWIKVYVIYLSIGCIITSSNEI